MARRLAFLALSLSVAGCSAMPTSPSALPAGIGLQGAAPLLAEPTLSGTAYQLVDVTSDPNFTSGTMTFFNNTNGDSTNPVVAPWGAGTTFRRAQLDRYQAGDVCRGIAEFYNTINDVNSDGFVGALGALAGNSCGARIIVQYGYPTFPSDPILPPSPIQILSFQPIPRAE